MKLCAYNAANTFLLTLSFEISFTFFPQGSVFSCYLAPEATEDNWGRWKIVDYFQYFASDLISCCSLSKEYISNYYARCEINAMIDDDDNESIKRMFMYQLTTSDITKSKKSELCIFPSSLQRSPHIFFVSSCAEKSHSFSGDISALKHTHPDKKDPVLSWSWPLVSFN